MLYDDTSKIEWRAVVYESSLDGTSESQTADVHKCTDEDYEQFYPPEEENIKNIEFNRN